MAESFNIVAGSVVETSWKPSRQEGVVPIDVIVLDPGDEAHELFLAQHALCGELGIISAVADGIDPNAILGLVDRVPYSQDEVFAFLVNGGRVNIPCSVLAMDSVKASSRLMWAQEEGRTRLISHE